jgi:hypothetical protein
MRCLPIVAVVSLLALAPAARGQGDPRFPDRATRRDAAGCWDVGRGALLRLSPFGKHSLWAEATFARRPRGGPTVMSELAPWIRARHELEVPCRPRSQHGSFCRVRPEAGKLRVRVYAKSYRSRDVGHLVEDFLAPRTSCHVRRAH